MTQYNKKEIELLLSNGKSMADIGYIYGVSRQRIYQVIEYLGLDTPERSRKRKSEAWSAKQKWLWKILTTKNLNKVDKLEIFENIALPDCCPILGYQLEYEQGKGVRCDASPSLDRIDSSKPYLKSNVQIISWKANRIKNDASPEELKKVAEYMNNLK